MLIKKAPFSKGAVTLVTEDLFVIGYFKDYENDAKTKRL